MRELEYIKAEAARQLAGCEGLIGAILLGSISAGMGDDTSDYDVQLIFTDEAMARHPEYRDLTLALDRKCDLWANSLSELRGMDRDSYDAREYLHARFAIDEGGAIADAVRGIVRYPEAELPGIVAARLDGYYDGVYRSLKCFRHGFAFGGYQMAAREMEHLAETLWAVNGLIPPYINRVPRLLNALDRLPLPAEELRERMERIARDADAGAQIALFDRVTAFMREAGYGRVQEAWEGVLEAEIGRHRAGRDA